MPLWDLDPDTLRTYKPEVAEPDDFDEFWGSTLADARRHDLALVLTPVDTGLSLVEVFDVTFAGFGGQPVRGWLTKPAVHSGPLPAVLSCNGYGGGRGLPTAHLGWAVAGYAELFLDTRGQGSRWGDGGDTPDPVGSGPAAPGFMTRGILDPHEHYYRRLFTDAVRALQALRSIDFVDASRVAVAGGSQGGGMALAVAGLAPDEVAAVLPDVPFLCHIRRGVEITANDPYAEVATYLSVHRGHVDDAFRTLSYIDAVNHAKRAVAPARFSVALMDTVCPPSTVYAAYNHYGAAEKSIDVWPFNDHEGGLGHQWARQLPWIASVLGAGSTRPAA
jgi:cephalosporin-C deacetylase